MTAVTSPHDAAGPSGRAAPVGMPPSDRPVHGRATGHGEAQAEPARRDPFAPVVRLGKHASRVGLALGILVAVSTHGAGSARALSALIEMRDAVDHMREQLHEFFWATYDVDLVRDDKEDKEEPPEPIAEPEPIPEPEQPAPSPPEPEPEASTDPYEDEPPPAPGEASKVLTAPEDPREPVDLTGEGFVSGDGTGPGYGYVSAAGTAQRPTFDSRARVGGKEGGRGSGKPKPPPPPPVNRSRPAGLSGGRSWNCPFPPEADIEQIDRATAVIVVTVSAAGRPVSVRVLSDPGYGFGRAARQCAMGRSYEPALDRTGNPIQSTTPPINVRFRR